MQITEEEGGRRVQKNIKNTLHTAKANIASVGERIGQSVARIASLEKLLNPTSQGQDTTFEIKSLKILRKKLILESDRLSRSIPVLEQTLNILKERVGSYRYLKTEEEKMVLSIELITKKLALQRERLGEIENEIFKINRQLVCIEQLKNKNL